jgi:type VI secretion system protein ImpK
VSDNPFSEPEDDRTVIRPSPGGRRAAPPQSQQAEKAAPLPTFDPASPGISVSPLIGAASPLLQLLPALRAMRRAPDPQALRTRVQQDLRTFERRAREVGIAMDVLRPAHYALCASIDDAVLNTPWGAGSAWAGQTLVATLHPPARGSDQFFDEVRRILKASDRFLPVLELMFLCLGLGFTGRHRQGRGDAEPDQLRAQVHAAIAARRPPAGRELSRHWRGVAAPYQPGRREVPVWVAFTGALAVSAGLLLWTSSSLNAASDRLQARALAAAPARMPAISRAAVVQPLPPPPAPREPTALDRLRGMLQSDIDQQALGVLGTPTTVVIRIPDRSVFAQGSAVAQPSLLPLLGRVAAALRSEPGAVRVIDYTDNQPVHTVRFPSGFQFSDARAQAVRAIIARDLADQRRVTAEGRGAADPVAPNSTAEGRERNRRVEIVLQRQE